MIQWLTRILGFEERRHRRAAEREALKQQEVELERQRKELAEQARAKAAARRKLVESVMNKFKTSLPFDHSNSDLVQKAINRMADEELVKMGANPLSEEQLLVLLRQLEAIVASEQNRGTSVSSSPISDSRLKQDITPLSDSLKKVLALRGVAFKWSDDEIESGRSESRQIGLIAQEVRAIVPEVIELHNDGYMGVHYSQLVAILVEAIKDQQEQINELREWVKVHECADGRAEAFDTA